jgi:hypothetical protein
MLHLFRDGVGWLFREHHAIFTWDTAYAWDLLFKVMFHRFQQMSYVVELQSSCKMSSETVLPNGSIASL